MTGPEALLADREVAGRLDRCRAEDPTAEVTEVDAPRLEGGTLAEITGGSLFASSAVAVIRDLANLPAELHDQVLALATDTPAELALVLVHGGGQKGKGLVDKIKKSKRADVIDCPTVKAWELPQFVSGEVRRRKGRIDAGTAQLLVDAVGHDLRALSAAVGQLLADVEEGGAITEQLVRRYFAGRAEVTSFAVTDAALAGQTTKALEQLRWALSTGVAHVLVTSALASGLRGLGKLSGATGTGLREADLAREVGVPPWKLKSMRQQLRGWDDARLGAAIRAVATADAEIKGAADNPDFALERAVLAVSLAARS